MVDENMKGGQENILPDAAGLFYALRSMGYENTAAVADLIDNSIDAGASNIWISIDEDLSKIFIADDGIGMSNDVLRTAIRLGGKKVHDSGSDLGKYGLGLITASLSMGRVLRIITKQDGKYCTAVFDYDNIRETNLFNADFHESTDIEKTSFDYRTKNADSGTVLVIDKCDKLQYTRAKDLIGAVEETVSEVFRVYLSDGKHIFINGSEVNPYDPLLLAVKGNRRLVDTDIDVESNSGIKGKMHVLAVKIPDQGPRANKSLRLNIRGQGFYILRNNREIASALEFPEIFKKHNDFNLFRVEVNFNPDLDDLMGINLKKHDVAPSKEVINALNEVLKDSIKKVREEMKAKQKGNPFIEPIVPSEEKEKGATTTTTSPATVNGGDPVVVAPVKQEYEIIFKTYAGDEKDPLFRYTLSNNKITIYYNVLNPYYTGRIQVGMQEDVKVREVLDNAIEAGIRAYIESFGSASSLSLFVKEMQEAFSEKE